MGNLFLVIYISLLLGQLHKSVPANLATDLIPAMSQQERLELLAKRRSWERLGVQIEVAIDKKFPPGISSGLEIVKITEGSIAEKASFRVGDTIIAFHNERTEFVRGLYSAIKNARIAGERRPKVLLIRKNEIYWSAVVKFLPHTVRFFVE